MDFANDSFNKCFLDELDPNILNQNKESLLGDNYQNEMCHLKKYADINDIYFDSSKDNCSFMGMGIEDRFESYDQMTNVPYEFNVETKENVALLSESNENVVYPNSLYSSGVMDNFLSPSPSSTFSNYSFNRFNAEIEELLERSVENNFDNVHYMHDNDHNKNATPSPVSSESFINYDLFMNQPNSEELSENSSLGHDDNFDTEMKIEKVLPVKLDMFPELTNKHSIQKQYINCSRIKYVKQNVKPGQSNEKSHIVQFTTYPALKKVSHNNHLKVRNATSRPRFLSQYYGQRKVQETSQNFDSSNVVLPVGSSGFQVSIPSSASINVDSFSSLPNDHIQSNDCEIKNDNSMFSQNLRNNSEHNDLNTTNFSSGNRITIKICTGFERNKHAEDNNLLKLTKKMVLRSNDWESCSIDSPGSIDIDENVINSYPITVQRKISRIISSLKGEVNILPDNVINRLSIPVSTVMRGYLKPNELLCLKNQIKFLNLLDENVKHPICKLFSCRTCQDIQQWRKELNDLQKWRNLPDPKSSLLSLPKHLKWTNINNNAGDQDATATSMAMTSNKIGPAKEMDIGLATHHPPVFLQNNEVLPIDMSMLLNKGSIFHVKQLHIGNVSALADDNHNAIKLYFVDKSLLYEIELQIENNENSWLDAKVFYINIEVAFTSVCQLQSQKELEIELLVRETPTLLLIKKNPQRTIICEKDLPLSALQDSLVNSIRSQLVRSPFHKLQVTKGNFNRVKCCFINSCAWLDSPFVNNAERSLSETPKDWVIKEFSLDLKNLRTAISKCKTRKVGRPPKKRTSKKKCSKAKSKNCLKSIVLINIFSSDPLTNPDMENANSDDLVWVAEQSTLKASGWSET